MAKPKPIPDELRKSIQGASNSIPQLAELAGYFCAVVGGPKAFANLLFQEFAEAPSGSIIRQRILDMILRTIQNANQAMPLITEVQNLEEDDLEREMALVLEKVSGSGSEEKPEAKESPLPAEESVSGDRPSSSHGSGDRKINIDPPRIKPTRRSSKPPSTNAGGVVPRPESDPNDPNGSQGQA